MAESEFSRRLQKKDEARDRARIVESRLISIEGNSRLRDVVLYQRGVNFVDAEACRGSFPVRSCFGERQYLLLKFGKVPGHGVWGGCRRQPAGGLHREIHRDNQGQE